MSALVVVVSGIPGTGKSLVAEHAAGFLGAALLSKDIFEAALLRSGIDPEASGWATYEQLGSVAESQLRLGRSAVLDSVATNERIRSAWRDLARRHVATFRAVECICSDERLHRARIEGRRRDIAGWPELTWQEVLEVRSRYEPWASERLTLDAVRPLAQNLAALEMYLRA